MVSARLSRFVMAGALALAVATSAGCSALSPITSARPYSPSDGIRVQLGSSLTAENLLIVSAAKGDPGSLVGGLTNRSSGDLRVTLAAGTGNDVTVDVPAGVTVLLGSQSSAPARLTSVDVSPGGVLPVTISTPEGGSAQISIPVLDGTLSEYATLIPTPVPTPS